MAQSYVVKSLYTAISIVIEIVVGPGLDNPNTVQSRVYDTHLGHGEHMLQ